MEEFGEFGGEWRKWRSGGVEEWKGKKAQATVANLLSALRTVFTSACAACKS